ncbi:hypothetical protein TWF696_001489 [Orbilia brochopaga]|uniref:Uncharacterized protein n=1 Tax=Orbilia brochopaga TaxID=3140254 RepID=A0AAV9U9P3_9PEZI
MLSVTFILFSNVRAATTTTTLYETISNPETVTSFWRVCSNGWALPRCDQVIWSPDVISASNATSSAFQTTNGTSIFTGTASSSISGSTPGSISSGASSGSEPTTAGPTTTSSTVVIPTDAAFVLQGLNTSIYANLYVQFDDTNGKVILGDQGIARFVAFRLGSSGELVNAEDASEFAYIRYDSSIATEYPQEEAAILINVRSVLHGDQASLVSSDFVTVWSFDLATGQLGLVHDGRQYILYLTPATTNRKFARSGTHDSELDKRSISYNVYMLPADIPVPADSTFQKVALQVDNAMSFPSSDFASSTPTATSESTGSSTSGSSITNTTPPTSMSTRTPTSRTSQPTGSSSLPDAYDVITIYHLQEYCTSLLSYYTPSSVVATTSTKVNTVYSAMFSDIETFWSSTETLPKSTLVTGSPIPPPGPSRRQLLERDPPDQLTDYPSESISSACSRAASRPETVTSTETFSTSSITIVPTSSTTTYSTQSIGSILTKTGTAIHTTYIAGWSGNWILANSDPTDTTGIYYGRYLSPASDDESPSHIKVTTNSSNARPFTAVYDTSRSCWTLDISVGVAGDGRLVFATACSPDQQGDASDYRLDVISIDADRFPFSFQLDTTTFIASPDPGQNPIDGTFWYCPTGDALYYYDAAFPYYPAYPPDCVDTGLNNLRGIPAS